MITPDPLVIRARSYVLLGGLTLIMLCVGLGLWAMRTTISGAVMAPGVIDLERNREVVQHPQGGVVDEIAVRDGDVVTAGDLLIRIDMDHAEAELRFAKEQLFELRARQDRLRAEYTGATRVTFAADLERRAAQDPALRATLDGQRSLFDAGRDTLDKQARQLRARQEQIAARIAGIDAQLAALAAQQDMIGTALAAQQTLLSRGLSQAGAVLQLDRERAGIEGRIGELTAACAQARESIIETEINIEQRAAQYRQDAIARARELEQPMRKFRNDARQLAAEIALAEVRAPVAGIVHGMQIQTRRAVLRPAEPLLFLIPQDQPRIIAARVMPQHIDQIHVGQEVKLRLSALDQRLTPEVFGTVSRIAADAHEDERSGQRYFKTQIVLNPGEVDRLPPGAVLLPGMPVETYLHTAARSPLAYLIKPVTDYFARAFRES